MGLIGHDDDSHEAVLSDAISIELLWKDDRCASIRGLVTTCFGLAVVTQGFTGHLHVWGGGGGGGLVD